MGGPSHGRASLNFARTLSFLKRATREERRRRRRPRKPSSFTSSPSLRGVQPGWFANTGRSLLARSRGCHVTLSRLNGGRSIPEPRPAPSRELPQALGHRARQFRNGRRVPALIGRLENDRQFFAHLIRL